MYSTIGHVNQQFGEISRIPIVSSQGVDNNFDGVIEEYQIEMNLHTTPADLRSLTIMMFFDYMLDDVINLNMISMAYVRITTPYGASEINTHGRLNLKQKNPLKIYAFPYEDNKDMLFEVGTEENLSVANILKDYNRRNETTTYDYVSDITPPLPGGNSVKFSALIQIPTDEKIRFIPGNMALFKKFFIQYLGIWFIIFVFAASLIAYAYEKQIFKTTTITQLPNLNDLKVKG